MRFSASDGERRQRTTCPWTSGTRRAPARAMSKMSAGTIAPRIVVSELVAAARNSAAAFGIERDDLEAARLHLLDRLGVLHRRFGAHALLQRLRRGGDLRRGRPA